jgi:hypothetical protein
MFRGGFNQKRVRQRGHILLNISIFSGASFWSPQGEPEAEEEMEDEDPMANLT